MIGKGKSLKLKRVKESTQSIVPGLAQNASTLGTNQNEQKTTDNISSKTYQGMTILKQKIKKYTS